MKTTCATCNKEFDIRPGALNLDGNYCSKQCFWKSGKPRPERRTGKTIACSVCGVEVYTAKGRPNRLFCSMKCKGIASRHPERKCVICGKAFKPRMGRPEQPTCSRECGSVYRRNGQTKNCELCGVPVYVSNFRSKTSKNFFCCSEHANEWQGRRKTNHICKQCGNSFRWSPSRSKSGNHNITYCSLECRDADPERREMLLNMNANQQRISPTKLEISGHNILDDIGIEYVKQHLINNKFVVDVFIPSINLVVQFDGDYWHGKPDKYPIPDERQKRRMIFDKSQDAYMIECGYRVIRFWESDIKKRPDHVKQLLLSAIRS